MKHQILIFTLFFTTFVFCQANFKTELKNANPVSATSKITNDQKIEIHKNYLQKAIDNKEIAKQLYGNLFLYVDYYKAQDYVLLNKTLLEAEAIVKQTNNYSWKGAINMRKALVYDLNNEKQNVLKQYFEALENCKKAKDSLCIAESLEQLSTTYGELENFSKAHYYFNLAMPILKKFADSQQMALTYNNYSNLMERESNFSDSEKYLDSAIVITKKNKDLYKLTMYENNKASLLTSLKKYDEAAVLFDNLEKVNIKNKWNDRLVKNYLGQSVLYEKRKNYKLAFNYLKRFYILNDSINGKDIKLKIEDLEVKYKTKEKELKLAKINKVAERYLWIAIVLILAIIFIFWQWRKQVLASRKKQQSLLENLNVLTNLLIEKNQQIALQDQLKTHNDDDKLEVLELHSQRILTESDWTTFKGYFEKTYPNYIYKLRQTFPAITESEERLFLCIKLNLRTKETATMLGISDDSVKKTRNRLKKRLLLQADQDLLDYIRKF